METAICAPLIDLTKPLWRNGLPRWTSNSEVMGSSSINGAVPHENNHHVFKTKFMVVCATCDVHPLFVAYIVSWKERKLRTQIVHFFKLIFIRILRFYATVLRIVFLYNKVQQGYATRSSTLRLRVTCSTNWAIRAVDIWDNPFPHYTVFLTQVGEGILKTVLHLQLFLSRYSCHR